MVNLGLEKLWPSVQAKTESRRYRRDHISTKHQALLPDFWLSSHNKHCQEQSIKTTSKLKKGKTRTSRLNCALRDDEAVYGLV